MKINKSNIDKYVNLSGSDWSLYLIRGSVIGVNVLSILLLGLLMSPDSFGRFVYSWSLILIVSSVISLGAHQFLLREMSARQVGTNHGVSIAQAIRLVIIYPLIVLIFIGTLAWLTQLFSDLSTLLEIQITTTDFMLIGFSSYLTNLTLHVAAPLLVVGYSNISMMIRDAGPQINLVLAAIITKIMGDLNETELIMIYILISVLSLAIYGFWIYKLSKVNKYFRENVEKRNILGSLSAQIDILIAGIFMSPSSLGVYQILKRFSNLVSLPQIVANWAVSVNISKAFANKDLRQVQIYSNKGAYLMLFPSCLIVLLCLAFFPLILYIYDIDINIYMFVVFLVMILSSVVNIITGVNFTVALLCHLERQTIISRALGVIAMGVLLLSAGYRMTLLIVASSYAISSLLIQGYMWVVVKKKLAIDTSIFKLLKDLKS